MIAATLTFKLSYIFKIYIFGLVWVWVSKFFAGIPVPYQSNDVVPHYFYAFYGTIIAGI